MVRPGLGHSPRRACAAASGRKQPPNVACAVTHRHTCSGVVMVVGGSDYGYTYEPNSQSCDYVGDDDGAPLPSPTCSGGSYPQASGYVIVRRKRRKRRRDCRCNAGSCTFLGGDRFWDTHQGTGAFPATFATPSHRWQKTGPRPR